MVSRGGNMEYNMLGETELKTVLRQPSEYPNLYRIIVAQKNFEYRCADELQRQYMRKYLL